MEDHAFPVNRGCGRLHVLCQAKRRLERKGDPLRATSEGESPLAQQRGRSVPERGTYNITKDNTSGPLLSLLLHLILVRWFAQTISDSISWGEKRLGEATADGTNSRSLPPPYKDFVYATMADYIIATIVPCQYPLLTLPRRCPDSCGFGQASGWHQAPTPCPDLPPTRRGTTCESGPAPEETR